MHKKISLMHHFKLKQKYCIPAKTKLNRICSVYAINNPMTDYASVTAGVYMSFLIPIVESPFVHLI